MRRLKQKLVVSMIILLSLFVLGGNCVIAETNIPPVVDAGNDLAIPIDDLATTVIQGTVTDSDNTGTLLCAWENQDLQQLTPIMEVGANGECPLDLSDYYQSFETGVYTLTIYGLDGYAISSDSMVLTITNEAPVADAGNDLFIPIDELDTTVIQGIVTDPDNTGTLLCAWENQDLQQLTPIMEVGANGECPLDLSDSYQSFEIGVYTLTIYGLDGYAISSDSMVLTITNEAPVADAGNDIVITIDDLATTVIQGTVTDSDNTGTLLCAWEDQDLQQLTPIMEVGVNGECPLELGTLSIGTGIYTMTIYGLDGYAISSDSMVLTVVESNNAPTANAGTNITISSEAVPLTIIEGSATDPDGDVLNCRWIEGTNILHESPAGVNGECLLDLGLLTIPAGTYNIFLIVTDGHTASVDEMILTVDNSSPHSAPGGGGVYDVGADITLFGYVSDFDGALLNYQWIEGTNVICSGEISALAGGTPVQLPDCIASGLEPGTHMINLQVDDKVNLPDSNSVEVVISDSTFPTLAPVASQNLLWPPNRDMVNVVITANASDNDGLPVVLGATVTSNEPFEGLEDGDIGPDYTQALINGDGTIDLQLRRERSGSGNGRDYNVTITATDSSGNTSTAVVTISVPHDKGKK